MGMAKGNPSRASGSSPAGRIPFPAIVEEIRAHLPAGEAYLVGGAVRDSLLGRPSSDIDIILRGDGLQAAKSVASALGAAFYPLDSQRGIGRVILIRGISAPEARPAMRYTLDFASLRAPTIREDLEARDFTANAIAVPLADPELMIDPLGGERDVRGGILRVCSPHAVADDPVRAIRAIRLATQLGFRVEKETKEQVRAGAPLLRKVSAERVRDEFFRILAGKKVGAAIHSLEALGMLRVILPETVGLAETRPPPPQRHNIWEHTLRTLECLEALVDLLAGSPDRERAPDLMLGLARDRLRRFQPALEEHLTRPLSDERSARGLLFLAAILHDAAKPETETIDAAGQIHYLGHEQMGAEWAFRRAAALRFSNEEVQYISQIVRNHMRPLLLQSGGPVTRRAVFRFFRTTGPSGVAVCIFFLADTLATFGPELPPEKWQSAVEMAHSLLEGYFERAEELIRPTPLLSGDDLIRRFGLAPGPHIGELLDALREAQAAGEVTSMGEAVTLIERGLGRKESS
jgi:tRNA nucleotidyltransferase/poly(A) polymerase